MAELAPLGIDVASLPAGDAMRLSRWPEDGVPRRFVEKGSAWKDQVMDGRRVLALIGSGETSPTMVAVHRELVRGLGRPAVVLTTPYAFQENAEGVTEKARAYFARSVGLNVTAADDANFDALCAAGWVFAGPGSPSYALNNWRDGPVAEALRYRVRDGNGITVMASAAAITTGFAALPVYEIYKAGLPPRWLNGLDLLGILGLRVAVISHYDNTEGGRYDTRYCYLGERRLELLERELPGDAAILGIDEHTALVVDLAARMAWVAGKGGVTVRRAGNSVLLPSGSSATLQELRELIEGESCRAAPQSRRERAGTPSASVTAFPELVTAAEREFAAALAARNSAGMARAMLDLETAIAEWGTDTEEDQGTDQAREVLRGMIVRVGQAARDGLADPRQRWQVAIGSLVAVRESLRSQGLYESADTIRDALNSAGFDLQDTPEGPRWCGAGEQ